MENVSWVAEISQSLASVIHQFPVVQQMADLAIKSIVLLTAFVLIDAATGKKLTHTSRHLLWLNSLLCLALLPFVPAAFLLLDLAFPGGAGSVSQTALFELPVYASQQPQSWYINWGMVFVALYLIPATLLLARLLFALHSLGKLRRQSDRVVDAQLLTRLEELKHQLRITRTVDLRISHKAESPVSFGLFRPQIMLPVQAPHWNASIMTDVLLHELCHVKRLDWLTTLFAYVLACVFWINPLVWLALKRLREESENSCDTAVLNAGRSDTDYAESLLGVATSCIHARRNNLKRNSRNNGSNNPLLQTMLDQNTLKTRISRVLEENRMKATELKIEIKRTVALLMVLSVGTLGVLGSHQVLHAQQQPDPSMRLVDAEMIPLNTIQPRYPTQAAADGIEGWVQVRFTVSADGSVSESSISVVDAQPADIFTNNAIAAAKQFLFSPRIVGGQPVDVPNVQYVFRFMLSQESELAVPQ